MSRSLPPAQTQRIATTMSATGYQRGPKVDPLFHVSTAPIVLTTMPKTPRVSACGMGRRGAKRRRDVTASNAVDRAISHRQQEQGSRHRLAQGRVNPARMHHPIDAFVEGDDREHSREHSAILRPTRGRPFASSI